MRATLAYKIASGLLVFFAVAHTFGMLERGTKGPDVDAVVASMHSVHFNIMGAQRSLWDFYFGFGMLLTVFLLFSAVLAWQLGGLARESAAAARRLAGPFAACQVVVAVFGWTHFFLAPAITSTLIAALTGLAASQLGRQ